MAAVSCPGRRLLAAAALRLGAALFCDLDPLLSLLWAARLTLGELLGYCQKDVIDVHGRLGGRLHEQQAVLLGVGLSLGKLHHPLVGQVGLVARQRDDDVGGGLALQLLHPGLGSAECVRISYIIHYNGGLCAPIVHGSQTVVSLLASSVPDLKLHCCVI